jgi:hypothetical protein
MKRYGDSLSSNCQGELVNEHDKMVQVIYGGCGVRYGTFTRPAEIPKKRKTVNIFSLLKFGRKKPKGHGD